MEKKHEMIANLMHVRVLCRQTVERIDALLGDEGVGDTRYVYACKTGRCLHLAERHGGYCPSCSQAMAARTSRALSFEAVRP